MLFSFVGRFPDHRPKRIIGDWHVTMFAAFRIDESAPASEVPIMSSELPASTRRLIMRPEPVISDTLAAVLRH